MTEVASILFLFYANLLMGEFNRSAPKSKTLVTAFHDIFTPANFAIGFVAACAGYVVFELLREKL